MTTMYQELMELGFNRNEAKVYASLIKFGNADASQIIKDTKFHKNIVYDNLEKLIDKGLVTFVIEKGRKVFKIAPPNMLVQLFEEQQANLSKKKQKAKKLAQVIKKSRKKARHKQEAMVYRGVKGIKSFYNQLMEIGKDYVVFGAPEESVEVMGELFWLNFNKKLLEKNIRCRLIFNPSIREHGDLIKDRHVKIRYFDYDFEPKTETNVQCDRVAIIVWTDEPVLFLIQDKFVAGSYKEYFEEMWKKSVE